MQDILWGGVRNDTAPWRWIEVPKYVLVDEDGTPVYVTENEIAAVMFTEDFPGTHIVEAEECEVVDVDKERTC